MSCLPWMRAPSPLLHRLVHVVLALCAPLLAVPASAAEDDGRLWLTGSTRVGLPAAFSASLLLQTRFSDDIGEFERLVIRPSLGRSLGAGFSAAIGYGAHIIEEPTDKVEHRAWQQLSFEHRASFLNVVHRLRLEQRFLEGVDGTALRLRYLLGGSVPLFSSPLRASLRNELFFDLNSKRAGPDSGFGETRFFAGLSHPLGTALTLEGGYQLQYVDGRNQDAANHTLILSLSHSF